ncbi:Ethylene-responsive transcription factor ERF017 [Dichanthelium oligosanthes]|uniref:Ethylene-responsive transcription factor ERF017 n=1 Tax=Dichanthelium oligosanthes TaxID=888268 RepID=A0A1E5VKX3_9POAL|nr:Ethylene-responsive transcription factor ERF017 [Dichanthelium oligosanthes]
MSSSPEREGSGKKFKGVRKRKWGKWVSEIRLPNSRERIWLGSYDAPEKAARAFDAAFVCLRGPGAAGADLNFPDSPPPCRDGGCSSDPQEVQAAALSHANRAAVTAQQAAAALIMDVDSSALPPWEWDSVAHDTDVLGTGSAEVVAPVRADGSIDWRPVMAHPPPLFSPTGWGSNAYDFLQVPPPPFAADEDMEDSVHGASACLWSFDLRDSYFRY